jgi:protein-disulfide isomerase
VIVSVVAVAAILVLIVLLQRPGSTGVTDLLPPPANVAAATLADGEALGRSDAPLIVEIWADFQCPFCANLVKDYLPRLTTDFVVPGMVRIVPRDIAILDRGGSRESTESAVAARCAGAQGKYWPFHDWLYYNQRGENRGAFSTERLAAIANEVGVDRATWDSCVADPSQAAAIRQNTAEARTIGIASTPTLRFGDRTITGLPRTYGELAASIRGAVASAAPGMIGPSPASSPSQTATAHSPAPASSP